MLKEYLSKFYNNFNKSKNSKYIMFIRKGESLSNLSGLVCGQLDCKITPKGREQAHNYFEFLYPYINKFDNIYSSDLIRCKEFSEISLGFDYELEIKYSDLLRERDFGNDEGIYFDGLNSEEKKKFFDPNYKPENNGETWLEVRDRGLEFLNKEIKPNTFNLVYSHGGLINSLLTPKDKIHKENQNSEFFIDLGNSIGISFDENNKMTQHFLFDEIE